MSNRKKQPILKGHTLQSGLFIYTWRKVVWRYLLKKSRLEEQFILLQGEGGLCLSPSTNLQSLADQLK